LGVCTPHTCVRSQRRVYCCSLMLSVCIAHIHLDGCCLLMCSRAHKNTQMENYADAAMVEQVMAAVGSGCTEATARRLLAACGVACPPLCLLSPPLRVVCAVMHVSPGCRTRCRRSRVFECHGRRAREKGCGGVCMVFGGGKAAGEGEGEGERNDESGRRARAGNDCDKAARLANQALEALHKSWDQVCACACACACACLPSAPTWC